MENFEKSSGIESPYPQLITTASVASIAIFNKIKKYYVFIFAFLTTILFYLPALQQGSINAGILYSGDVLSYYLPALMKTHVLLSHHHFSAIDYSLFNGSSDFFLNANFFPLHPIVVIYSLIMPFKAVTLQSTGRFLIFMLAFHSFLACYFSLKLFTRYFSFSFSMALLIATGFAFSWDMVGATMEPSFLFCVSVVPWVLYSVLRYSEQPSFTLLLYACLPITLAFLGGYLPVGLSCLLMSAILIMAKLLFIDSSIKRTQQHQVSILIVASIPFFGGLLIVSPYLYAAYQFLKQTTSMSGGGLFYSAYQLAELPQTFIRAISSHFVVPGPFAEFTVLWGIIAVIIFGVFFLSSTAINTLNVREWKIFKVAAILYFATVLATYGEHSVVSSFVYYLVPQIGKMHIYQRFLLPAQLLFMIMIALMLKALLISRPQKLFKYALVFLVLVAFSFGFLMTYRSNYALMFGINNFLLFELILGCLFAGMLLIPGEKFVFYGTIILFSLPAFNQMYAVSQGSNTFVEARNRQPMALNTELQSQLLNYLERFKQKKIIKYVDITPIWSTSGVEVFPKDFSHLMLNKINLSSYSGTTFYLSALANYTHKMPVGGDKVTVNPDWQWLKNTGADFIIATKQDIAENTTLQEMVKRNKKEDLYDLPNEAVIIPLEEDNKMSALYDNGYFRVYPSYHFSNLALNKAAEQSGEHTIAPAQLATDGNTDGDFFHGSVSHTTQNQNAWLDIDLGKIESIDSIKIWNRTDCCSERLQDYWVFISDLPFLKSDTVSKLRARPTVWRQAGYSASPTYTMSTLGVKGRYVRVQLSGTKPLQESFLSLAEIEVLKNISPANTKVATFKNAKFYSNDANNMRLEFEATMPTTVQYLFWNNPRLKYYLNGKKVTPVDDGGLQTLNVPAGKNNIEIHYTHRSLLLFWIFYTIFIFLLLCTFLPKSLMNNLKRKKYYES
jgi:hypothetical protein